MKRVQRFCRLGVRLSRWIPCVGFWLFAGATIAMADDPARSVWQTAYGPLELSVSASGASSGGYSEFQGQIFGQVDPVHKTLIGYWVQPTSEVRCAEPRHGSRYWGRVEWRFDGWEALSGRWFYCDSPKTSGGWQGQMVSGRHPLRLWPEAGSGGGSLGPPKWPPPAR